jgi:predicted negative regulator of RcsB-dependent stress response
MAEDIIEAQYDVTKKSKLKKFYEKNKIFIFSFVFILIFVFGSFSFYLENKEKKRVLLSENYLQAKIYLESGKKNKAIGILKEVIFANDSTYSTLSLFLIMNQNLITDYRELSALFDHLLEKNKFSKEERNLLIYKKTLLNSNFVDESKMLESINPLLNTETFWKPHGLLLLGDYFVSKGEYIKAIEFYQKIFIINNLHNDLYNHARSQLSIISNE